VFTGVGRISTRKRRRRRWCSVTSAIPILACTRLREGRWYGGRWARQVVDYDAVVRMELVAFLKHPAVADSCSCMYMCTCICRYVFAYIHIYIYVYVYMHIYIYMCVYIYTYIYIYKYINTRIDIFAYICIYLYMYIRYTHTHDMYIRYTHTHDMVMGKSDGDILWHYVPTSSPHIMWHLSSDTHDMSQVTHT